MNKNSIRYFFIFFILSLFNLNSALAEKYLEVEKLYDLYSKNILNIDQVSSGLDKMNLNNENIINLISLRKKNIISKNDFIDGVKKVITNIDNVNNKIEQNISHTHESDIKKYEFQTEITIIHNFINSDFSYGEIWNHMFVIVDNKITEISFKDSENIDLIKLNKPRIRYLKDNKFTIKSNAIYLAEPSVGIRYDFKGEFKKEKIVGEVIITYTESDSSGTVLLRANTR